MLSWTFNRCQTPEFPVGKMVLFRLRLMTVIAFIGSLAKPLLFPLQGLKIPLNSRLFHTSIGRCCIGFPKSSRCWLISTFHKKLICNIEQNISCVLQHTCRNHSRLGPVVRKSIELNPDCVNVCFIFSTFCREFLLLLLAFQNWLLLK